MFTGIVEELGTVLAIEHLADAARLRIEGPLVVSDAVHGASIAVDGVCLTVTDHDATSFTADLMAQTLTSSSLGSLAVGDRVNLERAVRADARLGGHIVQGHVDGVGKVVSVHPAEHWTVVRVSLPADLARYVVAKGSITVSGVSLTVSAVSATDAAEPWFEVSLIPTTQGLTSLGAAREGQSVNLEVDVLAKYVERLLPGRTS
jgi:riboflavin synthase